jgi:hypothetical protein
MAYFHVFDNYYSLNVQSLETLTATGPICHPYWIYGKKLLHWPGQGVRPADLADFPITGSSGRIVRRPRQPCQTPML